MAADDAKTKLKDGWIHLLVTFEVIGKPKEHVEKAITDFLAALKKQTDKVHWLEEHVEKAEKGEGDFFNTFAEVDMLVKNLETVTWLSVNYTPASIEVIEPTEYKLSALDVQNWQNDLLAVLHQVSMQYKRQTSQLEFLKTNFTQLIGNSILLSLARSAKTLEQLNKDTSLTTETLEPHLKKLIEDKRISEQKGVYSLA